MDDNRQANTQPEPVRAADRITPELVECVRQHKVELLAAVAESDCETESAVPPPLFGHLDLVAIADAIADQPRAPFENDLALSHAARAALGAERILRDLPATARREALTLCANIARDAAAMIRGRNYRSAYDLLDDLSDRLIALRPQ